MSFPAAKSALQTIGFSFPPTSEEIQSIDEIIELSLMKKHEAELAQLNHRIQSMTTTPDDFLPGWMKYLPSFKVEYHIPRYTCYSPFAERIPTERYDLASDLLISKFRFGFTAKAIESVLTEFEGEIPHEISEFARNDIEVTVFHKYIDITDGTIHLNWIEDKMKCLETFPILKAIGATFTWFLNGLKFPLGLEITDSGDTSDPQYKLQYRINEDLDVDTPYFHGMTKEQRMLESYNCAVSFLESLPWLSKDLQQALWIGCNSVEWEFVDEMIDSGDFEEKSLQLALEMKELVEMVNDSKFSNYDRRFYNSRGTYDKKLITPIITTETPPQPRKRRKY